MNDYEKSAKRGNHGCAVFLRYYEQLGYQFCRGKRQEQLRSFYLLELNSSIKLLYMHIERKQTERNEFWVLE